MHAAADRPEFAPPPQPGLLNGLALALLAHLLLVVALAWGVQWNRQSQDLAVEAELWASLPQEAAPREVPVPPAPPAPPVVQAPPQPDPQALREAQIALEREREREKREAEAKRAAEREEVRRRQEAALREAERRKAEVERQRQAEQERKREEAAKLAAEKKRKEEQARKRREEQERRLAQLREDNLKRIQGMAGGTGAPNASGTAARSAGPSASWAGKVRAKVKPNIVFTDNISSNPTAEVEVRLAPDGTIVGKRLVKASGHKDWDEAVLRALERTAVLPRDTDGSVHSPVVISFRPKD